MDPLIGQVINQKFVVERLLGEGGMGKVYAGEQLGIGRKVAIKVLHDGLSKIPAVATRFEREAAAAGRVVHPNSVTVFDFGRDPSGRLYLAMEYLDGEALSARLKREGRLSVERAVAFSSQLLETLEACHAAGVVHRDLKPDNIFLCPNPNAEIVKILDYGVARVADAPEVTKTGQLIGTPVYMSPEQATGKKVTLATDLYSIGVVFVEMLTGRPPYIEKSHLDLFRKHLSAPIPTLGELAPDRGELIHFEAIIQKVLAKKPEDRFASSKELRAAIQRAAFDLRSGKFAALWSTRPASNNTLADFGSKPTLASIDENSTTTAEETVLPGTLELSQTSDGGGPELASEQNAGASRTGTSHGVSHRAKNSTNDQRERGSEPIVWSSGTLAQTPKPPHPGAGNAIQLALARTELPDDTVAPGDVEQTVAMGKIELPDGSLPYEDTAIAVTPSPKATPRVVLDNAKLKRSAPKIDSSKIEAISARAPAIIDDPRIQSARLPKAELPAAPQPFTTPAEDLPFFTAPEQSALDLSTVMSSKANPRASWPLFVSAVLLLAAAAVFLWPSSLPKEILLKTEPPGAKILINQVARSGTTPLRLTLPSGEVTLEAQKEGCAPTRQTLNLEKNTQQIILVLRCQ